MIVLVGLPGSGKSTWASRQTATVLSSDAMRHLLSGDEQNQSIHGKVFGAMRHILKSRLEIGASPTIIDATNLKRRDRKPWIVLANKFGAAVEAVYFDVTLDVALDRNRMRPRVVPDDVIREMSVKLQPPSGQEGFSRIVTISASSKAKAKSVAK